MLTRFVLHHECAQKQTRLFADGGNAAIQELASQLIKSYDADVQLVRSLQDF